MKALGIITLLIFFSGCSSSLKKNQLNVEADQAAELEITEDIGSAFEGDQQKRLEFLKGKITEKRKALDELSADEQNTETAEVLENEILLLEAERFNIQSIDEEEDTEMQP